MQAGGQSAPCVTAHRIVASSALLIYWTSAHLLDLRSSIGPPRFYCTSAHLLDLRSSIGPPLIYWTSALPLDLRSSIGPPLFHWTSALLLDLRSSIGPPLFYWTSALLLDLRASIGPPLFYWTSALIVTSNRVVTSNALRLSHPAQRHPYHITHPRRCKKIIQEGGGMRSNATIIPLTPLKHKHYNTIAYNSMMYTCIPAPAQSGGRGWRRGRGCGRAWTCLK
jgi:hypothetical protein